MYVCVYMYFSLNYILFWLLLFFCKKVLFLVVGNCKQFYTKFNQIVTMFSAHFFMFFFVGFFVWCCFKNIVVRKIHQKKKAEKKLLPHIMRCISCIRFINCLWIFVARREFIYFSFIVEGFFFVTQIFVVTATATTTIVIK